MITHLLSSSAVTTLYYHGHFLCGLLDDVMFEYEEEMRLLTSISGAFALNVHMAPLPVLFQGTALLIAPTAVVALEGLLYCKPEFQICVF